MPWKQISLDPIFPAINYYYFKKTKYFLSIEAFEKLQLPFLAQYLNEMFKCLYCTQIWAAYYVRVRSWWKQDWIKPLNYVPFTWFKYIASISLINVSKKGKLQNSTEIQMHSSFTKYIQPLIRHNLTTLGLPYKGVSFFSFIWTQKVMCTKLFIWKE